MIQPRVRQLVEKQCPPEMRAEVLDLLNDKCTASAFHIRDTAAQLLERIQMAIIRKSDWNPQFMATTIERDSVDFRDLLMARGFGHDTEAHIDWWKTAMKTGQTD